MSLPDDPKKPKCRALESSYDRKKKSKKQEDRVAGKIGGRRQRGSGSRNASASHKSSRANPFAVASATGKTAHGTALLPGDVTHDTFLVEAKRTDAKSIRIEGDWLLKISAEAEQLKKIPAIAFEIGGASDLIEKDWIAVPATIFNQIFKDSEEEI